MRLLLVYSSKQKLTKDSFTKDAYSTIEAVALNLDSIRTKTLLFLLRSKYLRSVYCKRHTRLMITYFLTFFICAFLSIQRPDLLLVFGPLIYGFPHLISSYYYTIRPNDLYRNFAPQFHFLGVLTLLFVSTKVLFFYQKAVFGLPNGIPALLIVSLGFLYQLLKSEKWNKRSIAVLLVTNIIITHYAWYYPLLFLSATLFMHNAVAFIIWIIKAQNTKDRNVALLATFSFITFCVFICLGHLDFLFPKFINNELLSANILSTTWILTPWTNSVIIGQRALTLYTLGLSLHYFIWLKAIPENIQLAQAPPSFRISLKRVKKEIGNNSIFVITLLFCSLLVIWLYSYTLGSYIYFLLAGLHFWIELIGFTLPSNELPLATKQ